MADAMADHIVLDAAQCLPRVVVVTAQLPRTIAQCLETAFDFAVGTGAACHPVRGQPANTRALIRPRAWSHWLKTHCLE